MILSPVIGSVLFLFFESNSHKINFTKVVVFMKTNTQNRGNSLYHFPKD